MNFKALWSCIADRMRKKRKERIMKLGRKERKELTRMEIKLQHLKEEREKQKEIVKRKIRTHAQVIRSAILFKKSAEEEFRKKVGLSNFEPSSHVFSRFSYEELNEATECFKKRIGDGGFSSVYLGTLRDGRMVAVKVLYDGPKWVKEFTNEVNVLSEHRHPNLVSLYGCTDPGSQKLLLVYEFVPNGTIYDHLHIKRSPLPWAVRMEIAIEAAKALTYLHSLETPIIHRDVKTSNILLDDEFHVKIADFGMCRLLPSDTTCVTTLPQGTQGYRDPEYDIHCKLTAKSDVYSFGVVLLELISGEQAVDVNREESDIYLFRMAINKIMKKQLEQLVDRKVGYHYNCENYDCKNKRMIDSVAELACICLQPKANRRPSMEEVLSTLEAIRNGTEPNRRRRTSLMLCWSIQCHFFI